MDKNSNSLNWFEIPALDITRATKFYETIFGITMEKMQEMMGMKMSGFPADMGNGKASGALVQSQQHKPSMDGCVIYLNANPTIQTIIDRIEKSFVTNPFGTTDDKRLYLQLSFGFASFGKDGETAEQLLKHAILRKQQSKSKSSGKKVLFFPKEYVN